MKDHAQAQPLREHILRLLQDQRELLRDQYSVRRIGIFGSCVRNEAGPASDIDFLVELESPTFDHYMGLKLYLEDMLSRRVDLVMASALRPRLREHILREVQYAA